MRVHLKFSLAVESSCSRVNKSTRPLRQIWGFVVRVYFTFSTTTVCTNPYAFRGSLTVCTCMSLRSMVGGTSISDPEKRSDAKLATVLDALR